MSQRLLICKSDDVPKKHQYDCVLTEKTKHPMQELANKFFAWDVVSYFGPWRIWIKDMDVYREHEDFLVKIFKGLGHKYPEDVWTIRAGNMDLVHPTMEEVRSL